MSAPMSEPLGYLWTMATTAACTAAALVVPLPRRSSPMRLSYLLSMVVAEVPVLALAWLAGWSALALAEGDLRTRSGAVGLGLGAVAAVGLAVVATVASRAPAVVARALEEGLGPGVPTPTRPSWIRWLAPLPVRPRDVEHVRGIRYGSARRQRLDLYLPRARPTGGPVLVHLHGGGFSSGGRSREARALLHRMASRGWVCVSAGYRLGPGAPFPDPLVDVKRVLAWVQRHGREHGGDPSRVVVAGSSAGGHLAALAAFTSADSTLQPGFEEADTSVAAVVSLYGYPGPVADSGRTWSPTDGVVPGAPPFLVVHGARDSLVVVGDARRFVDRLRAVSRAAVVHIELPGAQHGFDMLRSFRFEAVVDGIEVFLAHVVGGPAAPSDLPAAAGVTPAANTQARRGARG